MKKILTFGLIILIICSAVPAYADVSSDFTFDTRGNYMDIIYNSANGMPTSEANDIICDDDGFIWIACYSGLIRHDGVNFERIANSMLTSVCALCCDSLGRLWIATNDHGAILKVDEDEYRTFTRADGLTSSSVRSIVELANGYVVLGTTDGLHLVDPSGRVYPFGQGINVQHPSSLAAYGADSLVCVTNSGDIVLFKGTQQVEIAEYDGSYPQPECVAIDGEGRFWFGTDSEYVLVGDVKDGKLDYEAISSGSLSTINKIFFTGERAWLCSDAGVGYIEDGAGYPLTSEMNNSVDSMCRDKEGNLWFASSRLGVMKLTENNFKYLFKSYKLDESVTNAVIKSGDLLYIGTDDGLRIVDTVTNRAVENALSSALSDVRIRCIIESSDGAIWVASYSGVYKYTSDGKTSVFDTENGLPTNKTRSVVELSDHSIAVGTSNGLCIINGGRVEHVYNEEDGLANPDILSICESPFGALLLGTDGGGVFRYYRNEFANLFRDDVSLISDVVMRIKYDAKCGGFWFVTGSGLEFYDGLTLKNLSNFPYFNNYDLYFKDGSNALWVLGSGGIYIVDREQLLTGGDVNYTSYSHPDGLLSDLTANSFSYLSEDDVLYICSSSGVIAIDWNSPGNSSVPILVTPRVYADGVYQGASSGFVTIPSDTAVLTIESYALSYTLHDPLISYKLEGLDEDYVTVHRSEIGDIKYNNLAGGEYAFIISVLEPISGDIIAEARVPIVKPKIFRETVWFVVSIVAACAGVIAGTLIIFFTRKIKTANKKSESARHLTNQIIATFSKVIDAKDKYTNGHSHRVALYSRQIAEEMGMEPERVEELYNIALLHDIGKLGIPDEILNKKGPLTDEEYALMKKHTTIGAEILSDIDILPEIGLGARYHHERFDGRGYMTGLESEEIPQTCRIIAAADSFDAMNSNRVYRKSMSAEKILSELERGRGTQFDPEVVDALLSLIHKGDIDMSDILPETEEPSKT